MKKTRKVLSKVRDCQSAAVQRREMAERFKEAGDGYHSKLYAEQAEEKEAEARSLLSVAPGQIDRVMGGEAIPVMPDKDDRRIALRIRDTLETPTLVSVAASEERLKLAAEAKCLETGMDVAESIDAGNSIEKMLAHQLAALHGMAMRMAARAEMILNPDVGVLNPSEEYIQRASKDIVLAARLMETFQKGVKTLTQLRAGGRQEVVVQYVNVTDGGQAMVTGKH